MAVLKVPAQFFVFALCVAISVTVGATQAQVSGIIDDFSDISGWSTHQADGVGVEIHSEVDLNNQGMRIDFRFLKGGGYAVVHKEFSLDLPENYRFSFRVRGNAPPNHLEFKLIDASGENVWWSVQRDVVFSNEWKEFKIKRRHIRFAWGPLGGGEIRKVAAIELAITAGTGGAGTVWIDQLRLTPLAPPDEAPPPPIATASTQREGHPASSSLDADPKTIWWSRPDDPAPSITLDLQGLREFGGLVIDWAPGLQPRSYFLTTSEDGETWLPLHRVEDGNGGRDYLYLPETEASFCRIEGIQRIPGSGIAIEELILQPLEWSSSRAMFFQAIAKDTSRGTYPRSFSGEQSYWTVVGIPNDDQECLLSEDGMLEVAKSEFSIEPFLFVDDRLVSWNDADARLWLDKGYLPIPFVEWGFDDLHLTTSAFAFGEPGASSVVVRYQISNSRSDPATLTLYLALRPFQVNPPPQLLNIQGGTAPIHQIQASGREVLVNENRRIVGLAEPTGFGAVTFDGGEIVGDFLMRGALPKHAKVYDSFGAASAAFAYQMELSPGAEQEIAILVPLHENSPAPDVIGETEMRQWIEEKRAAVTKSWEERINRFSLLLPESTSKSYETVKSQLAYILINAAGPAIQPGSRSYARSWIRDGALTSSALLRLGHPETVRAFIDWYAPNQYANGKVPCVVDHRGADPVPEHDSNGEFIFLIAEYYRHTKDREFLELMWPRVESAAAYLDSLRHLRRTDQYRTAENRAFYGLLPESISHEGYSAKPMHSYWDDFFALRGFDDAVFCAGELGRKLDRIHLGSVRDEFQWDLLASINAAMEIHEIDYIPGCADLGDFDATSTTIALSPVGAENLLPRAALERTFERYYEFFVDRRDGAPWDVFTPYEMRNIGAFVRLGWRDRAHELIDYFLGYLRPPGWNQWAEVVASDSRAPRFLGDMPHTWVGSDFARSFLDIFAYERESDDALIIGAGIPLSWLLSGSEVGAVGLPTPHGELSYTMRVRNRLVSIRIEAGLDIPGGGIVILPPHADAISKVVVNDVATALDPSGEITVRVLPARVTLHYQGVR